MDKFKVTIENKSIFLFIKSKKISDLIKNNHEGITKTIPCYINYEGTVDQIDEKSDYLYYNSSNTCNVKINKELNISELSLEEDSLFFPDLVYLLMCKFAGAFQRENKYFIQASVVKYDNGNSIMFIGKPNSGKTTLATKLLLTGNWSLISNDNVLVNANNNKLESITGTKNVQMRYGGINLFFPSIPKEKITHQDIGNRNEWDIKIYIDEYLKEQNIKYKEFSTITDIYLINTNKSCDAIIREREKIDKLLLLYEELTKQIRSNRYILTSFNCPIPSFENEEYLQKRYNAAQSIIENTNIYDLNGDVDVAIRKLRRKHEK